MKLKHPLETKTYKQLWAMVDELRAELAASQAREKRLRELLEVFSDGDDAGRAYDTYACIFCGGIFDDDDESNPHMADCPITRALAALDEDKETSNGQQHDN